MKNLFTLELRECNLTAADVLQLAEIIPHMNHLKKLDISGNKMTKDFHRGTLTALQLLAHSNVIKLSVHSTNLSVLIQLAPQDYYSAFRDLVTNGLEKLCIGGEDIDDTLLSMLSSPSSVKTLYLLQSNFSPDLYRNTCLTKLYIELPHSPPAEKLSFSALYRKMVVTIIILTVMQCYIPR